MDYRCTPFSPTAMENRLEVDKVSDPISDAASVMLDGMEIKRRRAIEAEARRLRERLLPIKFYADKEKRNGGRCWIQLAMSYGGEE